MSDNQKSEAAGQPGAKNQSNERFAPALLRARQDIIDSTQASPDWWALFEAIDPDIASREEVLELLDTAPNDFTRGVIYGKLSMRIQMAMVTGIPF